MVSQERKRSLVYSYNKCGSVNAGKNSINYFQYIEYLSINTYDKLLNRDFDQFQPKPSLKNIINITNFYIIIFFEINFCQNIEKL